MKHKRTRDTLKGVEMNGAVERIAAPWRHAFNLLQDITNPVTESKPMRGSRLKYRNQVQILDTFVGD